jgi:hypothetical protein
MATPKERIQLSKQLIIKKYDIGYYFIHNYNNYVMDTIALDYNKNIINYCSDWNYFVLNKNYKANFISVKNNIDFSNINIEHLDKNVIPIIPSFRTGVHAYSYFYNIIYTYINDNFNKYILLYEDTFIGLINIIDYLCKNKIIDKNKIIFIKNNICYKFKSITIIPNRVHSVIEDNEWMLTIKQFIKKYILIDNPPKIYDKICIIKTGAISSSLGVYNKNDVLTFCDKNNLTNIELKNFNEIEIIHMLSKCSIVVFSWGSTHMKNFIYLYNNIKQIYVIVCHQFRHEYNYLISHNCLIKQINNVKINYYLINDPVEIKNIVYI